MTFEEMTSFESLYAAYKKARIGKRKRQAAAQYEADVLHATERLSYLLRAGKYRPGPFRIFEVHEPKLRIVQAPTFVDKVVQHALVDNLLYDVITKSLILDNTASQRGKGTHFAINRLEHHMLTYFRRRKGKSENQRRADGLPPLPIDEWDFANGWVLKADVKNFFHSIRHDIMKEMLRQKVHDKDVLALMDAYIATSQGLPLGYQTSQLLALMYLNPFDHWIKERLGIKHYARHMDDFYLIHDDKDYLKHCLREITAYLDNLGLTLNQKTCIRPLRNGIDFVGFHLYLTETGGVVKKLRQANAKRQKRRIGKWVKEQAHGKANLEKIWESYSGWNAHAAYGDTRELRIKIKRKVTANFKDIRRR